MFFSRHMAGGCSNEAATAVVTVGMSAGGLQPLRSLTSMLPLDFPAALVVAHHVGDRTLLPELLTLWSLPPVYNAAPGQLLERGAIYVCPAGHHIVINPDGTLDVPDRGRVDFVRPNINWFFESAAASYAERAIAVVLSGANEDGASGAARVRRAGGHVIAQDPATCLHPSMPQAAIERGVTEIVSPQELAAAVMRRLSQLDLEPILPLNAA